MKIYGVLTVAQWVRTWHSVCEDAHLSPGLVQWVKDPALPQAVVEVADAAQIWCCCDCGVGHSCNSDSTPGPGPFICHRCSCKKKKKKSLNLKMVKSLCSKCFNYLPLLGWRKFPCNMACETLYGLTLPLWPYRALQFLPPLSTDQCSGHTGPFQGRYTCGSLSPQCSWCSHSAPPPSRLPLCLHCST